MKSEDVLLIMNKHSYIGREYLSKLEKNKIYVNVAEIGDYPTHNDFENKRCNYNWRPKAMNKISGFKINSFKSLNDTQFLKFLEKEKFTLGIQGGTGIIKKSIFGCFKLGILNFHPGDLPKYRGASAPEFQIYDDNPVVCTCHQIDEGIDSGPIHSKKNLSISYDNYYLFRSSIYPEISKFVVDAIKKFISTDKDIINFYEQNEVDSNYNKPIEKYKLQFIKKKFNNYV